VGSYPIKPVINAGDLSATFTLTPLNDSVVEANETVVFTVLNVTFNGGGGPLDLPAVTTGTGTIIDDDTALVSISGTPTVTEGGALAFTVTMSAPSSTDTAINYSFGGTATAGSDFTGTTTSVTIPAGATSAAITVPTTDDALVEADETVSVTLGTIIGNPGISLGLTTVDTGTINDNDTATVTISGTPAVTEGRDLTFTVTQSAVSSTDTTINYSFGGTATGGSDFTNTATSVTILAGTTTATVTVPTTDDALVEASETVIVTLVSTNHPEITPSVTNSATGTINDNDSARSSVRGAGTVREGAKLIFTVTQSAASSTDTTINYSLGGTATGGSDYTNTTTSVVVPAGATTATITVPTTDDALVELSETVSVTLGSTDNPRITSGVAAAATGTINDNDSA